MKRRIIVLIVLAVAVGVTLFALTRPRRQIMLTGIVTTDEVIASSEIQGRIGQLLVKEGDTVKKSDLLASIQPKEWQADLSFYSHSEQQSVALVSQAEADLKYQESQSSNQVQQAQANLDAAKAQVTEASADLENAKLTAHRLGGLFRQGVESAQVNDQTRTALDSAEARVESFRQQVLAAQAALALAKDSSELIAGRRAVLQANQGQLAAARAQKDKAKVRLDYTEIRAPINGIIDVRAALEGEVVNPGQAIVTLINPDDLWVRLDVEETYIDRIRLGDKMKVRLPSGEVREGTVFFRGVDADFATQRDVSRTKRDIKTFEVRLRCDNQDRKLAVGMTAYVSLGLQK